ncbi:hypothetical protein DAETH_11430 [Deinococcus aetherius]|uniref:Uncharacterized protein n=1 Tax=Deinococcus aetherius TaxID=200252 RepID=A0ABM8ABN6_9DEIO|nr:hypothetical protein [Deinococcus aetherius]BDP41174.1 hypothetical protein DAETH_11430 [Deinococcus aetherius]
MSLAPWPVTLATRQGWAVVADFEEVAIKRPDGLYWRVGSMYGNPQAALLTMAGKYAVVVGTGFIATDLSRFGEPIRDAEVWEKSAAVHCLAQPGVFWSFEAVYEPGEEGVVRLVADVYDKRAGIYELRLPDLTLTPLLTRSESPS